ncbi:hypothetical protein TRVL_04165 [Trypanosoma vivax]|nr:hypothetical protein TRVL_04165 [Trypanosoma vivax]
MVVVFVASGTRRKAGAWGSRRHRDARALMWPSWAAGGCSKQRMGDEPKGFGQWSFGGAGQRGRQRRSGVHESTCAGGKMRRMEETVDKNRGMNFRKMEVARDLEEPRGNSDGLVLDLYQRRAK